MLTSNACRALTNVRLSSSSQELIKVKGNQVAPAELEALLLEHPAVQDAAVVGVTINGEELPRAYIALQENSQGGATTEKDIASWLADKVAKHKRLAGGVKFVDAIPKNPSGKILRKILRDQAKTEVGDGPVRESRL
jgi:4-coumarate--CoA ligase